MSIKNRRRKMSRIEKLELDLTNAIRNERRERVSALLDELHRRGVHQGFAVEDAKNFLFRKKQNKRR